MAAFAAFDRDQSGYIEVDELQSILAKYGINGDGDGDVALQAVIRQCDRDHNGAEPLPSAALTNAGMIDYQEFLAYFGGGASFDDGDAFHTVTQIAYPCAARRL